VHPLQPLVQAGERASEAEHRVRGVGVGMLFPAKNPSSMMGVGPPTRAEGGAAQEVPAMFIQKEALKKECGAEVGPDRPLKVWRMRKRAFFWCQLSTPPPLAVEVS